MQLQHSKNSDIDETQVNAPEEVKKKRKAASSPCSPRVMKMCKEDINNSENGSFDIRKEVDFLPANSNLSFEEKLLVWPGESLQLFECKEESKVPEEEWSPIIPPYSSYYAESTTNLPFIEDPGNFENYNPFSSE
jgi:hypothetical protein